MNKKTILHNMIISMIVITLIAGCGGGGNSSINPAINPGPQPTSIFTAVPAPPLADIEGIVFESDGTTPLGGAFVVFYTYTDFSAAQSVPNGTATADGRGKYEFKNVPPGRCRVEAWRTEADYHLTPGSPHGAANGTADEAVNIINVVISIVEPIVTPVPTPIATSIPVNTPVNTPVPAATESGAVIIISGGLSEAIENSL